MLDFTMSPATQNHQTAVGKGIWQEEQVTSARGRGVEKEDHSKNQTGSFSPFPCQGGTTANISHLCPDFILKLANMSNGLSGKLESEVHKHPEQGMKKEVPRLRKEGGGSPGKCVSSVSRMWMFENYPVNHFILTGHGSVGVVFTA